MDHKYPNINDNSGSLYFIEVWAALPKSLCKRSFIGQPSWTSVYKSIVRRETSSISLLHFLFIYLSFSYRLTWDTCPSRKASWEMRWFLLRKHVNVRSPALSILTTFAYSGLDKTQGYIPRAQARFPHLLGYSRSFNLFFFFSSPISVEIAHKELSVIIIIFTILKFIIRWWMLKITLNWWVSLKSPRQLLSDNSSSN